MAARLQRARSLRARYDELRRRHAALLGRLGTRSAREESVYRLGSWGFELGRSAHAIVFDDRVQLANAGFRHLSRVTPGPFQSATSRRAARYATLAEVAIAEARALLDGEAHAAELRYRSLESGAVFTVQLERGRRGTLRLALVMIEDVAEHARRERDLERTREALLHRERLRVLGELAAALAHDLGSTLRSASFQVAVARAKGGDARALASIAAPVELASEVVTRLHDFARTGGLPIGAIRLDAIIDQAARLVDVELRNSPRPVRLRLRLGRLPPVRGAAPEVSLLFVNLLRNARDAMPEGGTVTLSARQSKGEVVVTVADEGVGLGPDQLQRLFQPFFTTKGAKGTGLGLWLAATTMARLGGSIAAANRKPRGARFTLRFPVVSPGGQARKAHDATFPHRRHGGPRRGRNSIAP